MRPAIHGKVMNYQINFESYGVMGLEFWYLAANQLAISVLDTHAILDLIPQRPPVVCVGELLEVSSEETRSAFVIPADFIFQKNGFVTAAGLLENIAQTAAARAGYLAKQNKEEVRLGFIASFKNVQSKNLPPIGTEINTKVTFMQNIMNMSIFYGEVFHDENLLLSCEIRILIDDKI